MKRHISKLWVLTTDRDNLNANKLTTNNADWLRRTMLNIFLPYLEPSCPNPHFVTKSERKSHWFEVSLFTVRLPCSVDSARQITAPISIKFKICEFLHELYHSKPNFMQFGDGRIKIEKILNDLRRIDPTVRSKSC